MLITLLYTVKCFVPLCREPKNIISNKKICDEELKIILFMRFLKKRSEKKK